MDFHSLVPRPLPRFYHAAMVISLQLQDIFSFVHFLVIKVVHAWTEPILLNMQLQNGILVFAYGNGSTWSTVRMLQQCILKAQLYFLPHITRMCASICVPLVSYSDLGCNTSCPISIDCDWRSSHKIKLAAKRYPYLESRVSSLTHTHILQKEEKYMLAKFVYLFHINFTRQ